MPKSIPWDGTSVNLSLVLLRYRISKTLPPLASCEWTILCLRHPEQEPAPQRGFSFRTHYSDLTG